MITNQLRQYQRGSKVTNSFAPIKYTPFPSRRHVTQELEIEYPLR